MAPRRSHLNGRPILVLASLLQACLTPPTHAAPVDGGSSPRVDAGRDASVVDAPHPADAGRAENASAPVLDDASAGLREAGPTAFDATSDHAEADTGDAGSPADARTDGAASYLPGRPEVICAQPTGMPVAPPESTFILDASVESADSLTLPSSGDLWPSCWSGDALYAGWGDGYGFSDAAAYPRPNIGLARIMGDPSVPDAMSGVTLVHDRGDTQSIFKVWTPGSYYQKPTGMLCTPGKMFVAVQDLNSSNYGDAPAATIAVSLDSGQTWSENTIAPMFDQHEFTTVMFLDYGQDGAWAADSYIYVYGLDYNWRYSETITSPQGLYLARVPSVDTLLDRTTWQYFGGPGDAGAPVWTADFTQRLPVLVDCSRRYATSTFPGYSVIAQGSIVYDQPRARYLYTSWTEYTYEFYESPTPWGPWTKFFYKDFGAPPWTPTANGGYATTIPSKYISQDGGAMWVQSNSWSSGVAENSFALRTLLVGE